MNWIKKLVSGIVTLILAALAFSAMLVAFVSLSMGGFVVVHGLKFRILQVDEMRQGEATIDFVFTIVCAVVAVAATTAGSVLAFRTIHWSVMILPIVALLAGFAVGVAHIQTLHCSAYFGIDACI